MTDDTPFLTVQEAAGELRLSDDKVRELIRTGALPALFAHDMRIVRIPRTAIHPEPGAARDLTIKRLRRAHLAAASARKHAMQTLRDLEAALREWERAEEAIDAEFALTDLDPERPARIA